MSTHLPPKQARKFQEDSLGFTIIELLIVIIVIAILSALALPSFLSQANKAKQSEARTYIGSMNRAQQAQYMEQGSFTLAVDSLGLGISTETGNYIYRVSASSVAGDNIVHRAVPSDGSLSNTPGSQSGARAYLGGVKVGTVGAAGEASTLSVICEALSPPVVSGEDGTTAEPGNLASASAGAPTCDPLTYRAMK